jgi:PleD family two-component response regulator
MAGPELPRIVRLLVISESPAVFAAIDRLCESFGEDRYVVRRAATSSEALEGDAAFDVILLDLQPLLGGGMSKAEGVVASVSSRGPLIALTGTLDRPTEQSLKRAGAADCLFDDEMNARALRRAIRTVIASGAAGQKRGLPRLFDPSTGLASQFLFWEILGLAARRAKRNKDHQLAILVESMPRVEDIQIVAEKIVQELTKPFPLGDLERRFPVNLGISLYPTSADNADMLIGKAFEALAGAKARGKGQFVFA